MKSPDDIQLRAYWLGVTPSSERERLEELCCGDEDLFTQLRLAESELLDDYAQNQLAPAEREQFQAHYLRQPAGPARAARAAALHEQLRALTPVTSVTSVVAEKINWRTWRGRLQWLPQVVMASLALFFLAGGFWLWYSSRPTSVAIHPPTATPTPIAPIAAVTPWPTPAATPVKSQPLPLTPPAATPFTPRPTPVRPVPAQTPRPPPVPPPVAPPPVRLAFSSPLLIPGVSRSTSDGVTDVTAKPGYTHLRLHLAVLDETVKTFAVEVLSGTSGATVWRGRARAKTIGGQPQAVCEIPLRKIPPDDYQVLLTPRTAPPVSGEPPREYQFRRVRP